MSNGPRILILGAGGQLGQELQASFSGAGDVIAHKRDTVDLANEQAVRRAIQDASPDVILNAAAYTAVDRAESEAEPAMAINGVAPGIMAEEAQRAKALLVHYSTDYVFDGSKDGPWLETDMPSPLSVYGRSKLAGEEAIRKSGGRYLIFRTSWVYGPIGHNFLLTMLRLAKDRDQIRVVDDQYGSPTSTAELAKATRTIVDGLLSGRLGATEDWAGVYHMTCAGSVSWCGFARAIFSASARNGGRVPTVMPISSAEYRTPAMRPHNSVLSSEKLHAAFGVRLAHWEAALQPVMERLRENEKKPEQSAGV